MTVMDAAATCMT